MLPALVPVWDRGVVASPEYARCPLVMEAVGGDTAYLAPATPVSWAPEVPSRLNALVDLAYLPADE